MTRSFHNTGHSVLRVLIVTVVSVMPVFSLADTAEIKDKDISFWVSDALRHDARIEGSQIKVATSGGIVTLNGNVRTIAARTYADREAKRIRGVLAVVNELKVLPVHRNDLDIAQDVRRRILQNSTIKAHNIRVLCHDGSVSLSGDVASHAEELEAELVASEVLGVRAVQNHLLATYATKFSDDDIRGDVKATLARDVYLSGRKINIDVDKGVVTLDGFVASAWEKSRAASDVTILSHVKSIDNQLRVDVLIDHNSTRESEAWATEEELQAAVQAELSLDGRLDASGISAEVEYGHVTLYGSVKTLRERRLAEQDSRDVVGVGWVSNEIVLNGPEREADRVAEDVRFELVSDAMLHPFRIGCNVAHGAVTLKGAVHSGYQKVHAEELAGRVKGVHRVINAISVDQDVNFSDAALSKAIRERLTWNYSTHLDASTITVTVNHGVAVLNGACDTWAARKEAERVAFNTDGVWQVRNNLIVTAFEYPWDTWKEQTEVYDFDPFFYRLHHYE